MNQIEKVKSLAKAGLNFYQKAFWYIAQAKNEALKPLGFWNETLLILTFLAVSGQRPTVAQIIGAYALILIVAVIVGKIIVMLGIVRYNTRIANHQNPELMEILQEIQNLKEEIKKTNGNSERK